jgi:hypothetical protein
VRRARTHGERETVNKRLRALRSEAIAALPKGNAGSSGVVLTVLETQINATAVAYSSEQKEAVRSAPDLKVETVTMPDIRKQEAKYRPALESARKFMSHPYENGWWRPVIRAFIVAHPNQIGADIEARNAGYVVYKQKPGTKPHGH